MLVQLLPDQLCACADIAGHDDRCTSTTRMTSESVHDLMSTRRSTEMLADEDQPWGLSRTISSQVHLKWLLSMDQLVLVRKVAQGSTGEVYLARYQVRTVLLYGSLPA